MAVPGVLGYVGELMTQEGKPRAAWVRCGDCGDWWCVIHGRHVHECECPAIEHWGDVDPYSERGSPCGTEVLEEELSRLRDRLELVESAMVVERGRRRKAERLYLGIREGLELMIGPSSVSVSPRTAAEIRCVMERCSDIVLEDNQ